MKTLTRKALTKFIAAVLAIFLLVPIAGFKILDPNASNKFLARLAWALDLYGIDVVQDWSSTVTLAGRPVLAPIANYHVSVAQKATEWTAAYEKFYANALVALKTSGSKQPVTAKTFIAKWNAAPIENRVFISFTKADLTQAESVKHILEKQGYKVFLYAENNRDTFTSPELIARCMRTAGEVLILDTENSRQSVGVIAEALAFAKYTYRPEAETRLDNELLKMQLKAAVADLEIKTPDASEMLNEVAAFYGVSSDSLSQKEKIKKKINENYQLNLDNYFTPASIEKGKEAYTNRLLEEGMLTPYAYNKKISSSLATLKENPVIDLLKATDDLLTSFGFCWYYKVPIQLCPICSRSLLTR